MRGWAFAGRMALIVVAGCSATPSATPTTAEQASSAQPAVYQASIAYELGAVTAAQTPAEHAALASTTFVSLKRPAAPPAGAKSVTFIIARDATFDVFEMGQTPPRPLTTFNADGSACVGRSARAVALKFEKTTEESVVLEGCAPPPNAYAVVVVEGAHPGATLVASPKGRVIRLSPGVELPVPEP